MLPACACRDMHNDMMAVVRKGGGANPPTAYGHESQCACPAVVSQARPTSALSLAEVGLACETSPPAGDMHAEMRTLYKVRVVFSELICANKARIGPPSANQGVSTDSQTKRTGAHFVKPYV